MNTSPPGRFEGPPSRACATSALEQNALLVVGSRGLALSFPHVAGGSACGGLRISPKSDFGGMKND